MAITRPVQSGQLVAIKREDLGYYVPCKVCECCKVQVTDNYDWMHLLCVINQHSVLRCDSIDYTIR